jgi:iron-sulfur cluster assembly protein
MLKQKPQRVRVDMAISLTNSAANRVRDHLEQRGSGIGLRLGVKKTGCSGFAYVINYADEVAANDNRLVGRSRSL